MGGCGRGGGGTRSELYRGVELCKGLVNGDDKCGNKRTSHHISSLRHAMSSPRTSMPMQSPIWAILMTASYCAASVLLVDDAGDAVDVEPEGVDTGRGTWSSTARRAVEDPERSGIVLLELGVGLGIEDVFGGEHEKDTEGMGSGCVGGGGGGAGTT